MTTRVKVLLGVGAGLLAILAVPVTILVATFTGNPPIPDGKVLAGGTTVVKDGYVSVFLVDVGHGKVALVDAGNDPSGMAIGVALKRKGLARSDVVAVLLTHGHPDHTASCGSYPNATIYAGSKELPLLQGKVAAKGPLPRLFGASESSCKSVVGVEDGQTIDVGDFEARAWSVPGHTAGSTAWLLSGTLFLGDAADATPSGDLAAAKWVFSDDQAEDRRSLVALSDRLENAHAMVTSIALAHTGVLEGMSPLKRFAAANR
jgi:glyoxylase-like metal-dependent hydrolase (beta-lactamase superfamily II)